MTGLLQGFDYWTWWVLALLFAIGELFVPGAILLWLAVAAAIVGFAVLLWPLVGGDLSWQVQWMLFAGLSVAGVLVARTWYRRHPIEAAHPHLNRRGDQYVGRTYTLAEAIRNGRGRLVVDDTTWRILGPDLPAGARVRIDGSDGTALKVVPAPEA